MTLYKWWPSWISPTMQCAKYFMATPLCWACLKPYVRHQNHESASIPSVNDIIFYFTLYKWHSSWILPTMQCLKYRQIQTDRYFIDRKKVNPNLFVIEIEICTCRPMYNIFNLLKSYDNIHSMTYITKIMLTGINWYTTLSGMP